jgi:hypothetical protein
MQTVEERPVIVNPDKFVSDRTMRRRHVNVCRPSLSKKRAGRERNGRYETAARRTSYGICEPCIHGEHAHCEFEMCPCACNDSDFRFSRNKLTAIGAMPVDVAKLAQRWAKPIDSATVCPTVAQS